MCLRVIGQGAADQKLHAGVLMFNVESEAELAAIDRVAGSKKSSTGSLAQAISRPRPPQLRTRSATPATNS